MGASRDQFIQDRDTATPADPPQRTISLIPMNEWEKGVTKNRMQEVANEIAGLVDTENLEAYKLYAYCKCIEEQAALIKDAIKDRAIIDIEKRNGETEIAGLTLKTKNAASRWDYSDIPDWNAKKAELKQIEEAGQLAWQVQQNKAIGTGVVVGEGGEVIPVAKKIPGVTTIEIKIAK